MLLFNCAFFENCLVIIKRYLLFILDNFINTSEYSYILIKLILFKIILLLSFIFNLYTIFNLWKLFISRLLLLLFSPLNVDDFIYFISFKFI